MLPAFESLDLRTVVYAVLSLTVVRMLPVAVSFIASGVDRSTTAFIGWFGPRGLASVVFALLAVEELGGTNPQVLVAVNTITVTVVFSILAHGFTGRPLATDYVSPRRDTGDEPDHGAALTMVAVVSSMSLGFTAPPPSEYGWFNTNTRRINTAVKDADRPTRIAWVPGVAPRVCTKIMSRTNAAPTSSRSQSILGNVVSAVTSLASRDVEMLPIWAARLVPVAECSTPVVGRSPCPSDSTRSR